MRLLSDVNAYAPPLSPQAHAPVIGEALDGPELSVRKLSLLAALHFA